MSGRRVDGVGCVAFGAKVEAMLVAVCWGHICAWLCFLVVCHNVCLEGRIRSGGEGWHCPCTVGYWAVSGVACSLGTHLAPWPILSCGTTWPVRVPATVGGPAWIKVWAYSHASCASWSVLNDRMLWRYVCISASLAGLWVRTYWAMVSISLAVAPECSMSLSSPRSGWDLPSVLSSSVSIASLELSSSECSPSLFVLASGSNWLVLAEGLASDWSSLLLLLLLLLFWFGDLRYGEAATTSCQLVPSSYGSLSDQSWAGLLFGGGVPGGLDWFLVSPVVGIWLSESVSASSSIVSAAAGRRWRRMLFANATSRLVWLFVGGLLLFLLLLFSCARGGLAATAAIVGSRTLSGNPGCCRMDDALRWCVSGVRRR